MIHHYPNHCSAIFGYPYVSLRVGSGKGQKTGAETGNLFGISAPAFEIRYRDSCDVEVYIVPNMATGESRRHRTIETRGTDPWVSSRGCAVPILGVPVENEKDETVHTTLCKRLVFRRGSVACSIRMCLTQQMSSRDDKPWEGVNSFLTQQLYPRATCISTRTCIVDTAKNVSIPGSCKAES